MRLGLGLGVVASHRGASAPVWLPTSMSVGVPAWYRSDLGITRTLTAVTKWANQGSGGTAYDLTPPGTSPDFNVASPNFTGRSSLSFTHGMKTGTISLAAPQTVILVGRGPGTTGHIAFSDQAASHWIYDNASGNAGIYAGASLGSGSPWLSTNGVVIAHFNAAASKVSFNNTSSFVTGNPGANSTFTEFWVGDFSSTGFQFIGEIVELIVTSSFPSAGDLASLRTYLNTLYPSLAAA